MQIQTVTFDYHFPNESPLFFYSKWTGIKIGAHWSFAQRLVTPKAFIPALELYKILLGDNWYDDTKWPMWLLEECRDSGMYIDYLDGMTLESIFRERDSYYSGREIWDLMNWSRDNIQGG